MSITSRLPKRVFLREVGPRDGLQNESKPLSTEEKEALVRRLVNAGFKDFELTSFVSPKAIPALSDASDLIKRLSDLNDVHFSALVPNLKGAQRALDSGINSIVLFVSASESHNQKNVNRTVAESLEGFEQVAKLIEGSDIQLRGAIATSFGCPFEGNVDVKNVVKIVSFFENLGALNLSLGDTTGMATPPIVEERIQQLSKVTDISKLTLHFHNTRGIGLVNVMAGLNLGVTQYESSIGGLGGCPFAPGASGNISSEDLVYLLDELDIESNIDIDKLIDTSKFVSQIMAKELPAHLYKTGPRLHTNNLTSVATATG